MSSSNHKNTSGGFSLLELLIAMVITMALMTAASTLLANALRVRSRENQKSDALADTQRALNIMSREIANSGFNMTGNGIVAADSVTDANGNSTATFTPTVPGTYTFSVALTNNAGVTATDTASVTVPVGGGSDTSGSTRSPGSPSASSNGGGGAIEFAYAALLLTASLARRLGRSAGRSAAHRSMFAPSKRGVVPPGTHAASGFSEL